MSRYYFIAVFSFLLSGSIDARWVTVSEFNQVVKDLLVFDNELYICGEFTKRGSSTSFRSTKYSGSSFNDNTNSFAGVGLREMVTFDDKLYAVGGSGLYVWDGSSWDNSPSNSRSSIHVHDNTLYTGGDFGIVKYKELGGSWMSLPTLEGFSSSIQAITTYNGELIVAGRFDNFGSTTLNGVAKWNGSTWVPLGEGLSGGVSGSEVTKSMVYNGELYLCGSFSGAGGSDIKNIAKWNGSTWSSVGGSNTGPGRNGIRDMMKHGGELFICGEFEEMGGTSANQVASWNGSSWKGIDLGDTESFPNCIGAFENDLYVGTFDFELAHLYKTAITTSTKKFTVENTMQIYPNPTSDFINIKLATNTNLKTSKIEIFDAQGKIIKVLNGDENSIPCSNWGKGIYYVFLRDKSNQYIEMGEVVIN